MVKIVLSLALVLFVAITSGAVEGDTLKHNNAVQLFTLAENVKAFRGDRGFGTLTLDRYYPSENISVEREISTPVILGLSAVYLTGGISIHLYQQNAWWKDQRRSFRFENDWDYALWIDKIGHFYGSVIYTQAFSGILDAAEIQPPTRVWLASGMALAMQLYIEIEDGFGAQWGFSPGDALFDILGAGYPIMQYYYPFLKDYNFKFSYLPADLDKVNPNSGQTHIFIDDYAGQKFWIATSLNKFLPTDLGKFIPDWINLAFGMGVSQLNGSGGGQRDFYLSLDFDAQGLPIGGRIGQFIKNAFSHAHFPAPGIRLTNGVVFFGLCY